MIDLDKIGAAASGLQGGRGESSDANAANVRVLRMLVRGWWLVLGLPLLFVGAMAVYLRGATPLYRASATLTVDPREVNLVGRNEDGGARQRAYLQQQAQVLRSERILRPLAGRIEGQRLRHFTERAEVPVIALLAGGLTAVVDASKDIIVVGFDSPYKDDAETVVTAALELYKDWLREVKRGVVREKSEILESERATRIEALRENTAAVLELKRRYPAISTSTSATDNFVARRLDAVSRALDEAHRQVVEAETHVEALDAARQDREELLRYAERWRLERPSSVLEAPIAHYLRQRQDLENELGTVLSSTSTPSAMIEAKRSQIEALRAKEREIVLQYADAYLNDARITLVEARRKEQKFLDDFATFEHDVNEVNAALAELAVLDRERTLIHQEIETFAGRIGQLSAEAEVGAMNVHVIEPPHAAAAPIKPNRPKLLGVALAGGLGLAFLVVLLRGVLDRKLRSVREIASLLGEDVVGVVPRLRGGADVARTGRVVELDADSLAAEGIRNVRTAANLGLPDGGFVVVTSAVSGEGKSVVASNLALALAQSGRRTLLVDADLRASRQAAIFGLPSGPGLGDAIAGRAALEETLVPDLAPGLDVLGAGDPTGGAAELLESHRYRALMHALRRIYDCIVVDTSPVLESAEARVVAAQGDLCVFVVRQERTSIFDARQALSVLRSVGTRVLGVLLTDARGRHVTHRRAVASAWTGADRRPRLRLLSSEDGPAGASEGDGGRRTWG